jgi:hypothetical protein
MKPVARVGRRGKRINRAVPEDGTMVDGLQFCVMSANRLCGVDSFFRISSNVQAAGRRFESLKDSTVSAFGKVPAWSATTQ